MAPRSILPLLQRIGGLRGREVPSGGISPLQLFPLVSPEADGRTSSDSERHLLSAHASTSDQSGGVRFTRSESPVKPAESCSLSPLPSSNLYLQPQCRAYSSDSQDENIASEGEEPPKKGGRGSAGDETGLPLIQRCKNVLVSNWRGQFSSIFPGATEGERNSVNTSLVRYAVLDGRPLIWLPRDDEHGANVAADKRASLMAGHTDPPALVQAIQKGCKRLPPLAVILGEVSEIDPSEAEYWRKRVRKLSSRALSAIEKVGPKAKALLDSIGPTIEAKQKALGEMAGDNELRAYRLEPKEWTYMDVAGERKSGTAEEFEGSLTDPLAHVSIPLIDALNHDNSTRKRLVLFAAAYMQVEARDAYIVSLDRWGFTCLVQRAFSIEPAEIGKPVTLKTGSDMGRNEGEWGEFRFSFSHEVRDAEGFCASIEAMEEDVIRHYKEQADAAEGAGSNRTH